jgi:predicted GIY-YIG superfamily endonuclease
MSTTLYRFYDGAERLLYIGITDSIGGRITQHRADKPWWPEVSIIRIESHETRRDAEIAEKAAIQAEEPVYNIVHVVKPTPVRVAASNRMGRPRSLNPRNMAVSIRFSDAELNEIRAAAARDSKKVGVWLREELVAEAERELAAAKRAK